MKAIYSPGSRSSRDPPTWVKADTWENPLFVETAAEWNMEPLSQLLCGVNPLTLLFLLPLFFEFLGQATWFYSANQKRGFTKASKQSCSLNQPQLVQNLPYKKAHLKRDVEGCKWSTARQWAQSRRSFKAAEVGWAGSDGRTKPAQLLAESSAGTRTLWRWWQRQRA